jgi:hypothetical protein
MDVFFIEHKSSFWVHLILFCKLHLVYEDRLCGLVVRVPGYDPEVPGSIHGHYKKKKVAGLEWGPLGLVSTTEELLGRNSSGSGLESR